MSDYYATLGVQRDASKAEIKTAYKQLALQYHPDTAAELTAEQQQLHEQKFKEISEAYAVLSDEAKRQQYDTFGNQQFHQKYSQSDIFSGADFSHVFDELNIRDLGDLFSQAFSGGFRVRQAQPKGQDVVYPMSISFIEAFHGVKKSISYHLPHQNGTENITVKVPAGVREGMKLKVPNKGAYGHGGVRGDLYVKVSIASHPIYTRSGDDLLMSQKISLSQALLGGKITVETCDGLKTVTLSAPANMQAKLRLKGLGFPVLGSSSQRGDLYCELWLDLPAQLTAEQQKLAAELKAVNL